MNTPNRNDAHLQRAVRAAKVGLWDWDLRANNVEFSTEWKRQLGYADAEISNDFGEWESRVHPDDLSGVKKLLADYFAKPWPNYEAEFRMRHKDGSWRWILAQADLLTDEQGQPAHMVGSHIDITEHMHARAEFGRVNRALRMLSDSNQALIRITDEATLLGEICRIAVEVGGYRMVWVGFAEHDGEKTVRPVAQVGFEKGRLETFGLTWTDQERGPTGTAIRTGQPCLARNLSSDTTDAPWREAAVQGGCRSAVALPLISEGRTFGVLSIYAGEGEAFDAEEIKILMELASDLAFGLTVLRTRAERDRAERERLAHLRFFEAMDQVNRAIQGAKNLEEMMSDVLEALLAIFDCDRAWLVYPCDPDAPSWRVPMERTRPEYPGAFALGSDFPMDPEVAAAMRIVRNTNGPVKFAPGTEHPVPAAAEAFGVRSFIAMALYPKLDKPYMFGLHQCSHPRIWTPEDERLFQEVGRRVTDSLTSLLAYQNLQQSQGAYASLVNNIDGIVWELDVPTFHFTFVSPQAERLLGYPVERWLGNADFWKDHVHPEDRSWALDFCLSATREKRDHDFQYRMIAADGRVVWLHDLVTVVVENDQPVKLRGIMVDITESKRGEEALKLFRALIDRTIDAIEVVDPDTGRFLDVNERACQTHGYSREEYLSMHVPDLEVGIALHSAERWRTHVESIRREGFKVIEGQHRRKDGSVFPVEVNTNYIHLDRGYVVSVVRDVTDRKRAEEALRESEQRFRQVTESIDEIFWLTDVAKNRMIYISPAYEKIWGRTCESLSTTPQSWLEAIHLDDRERVRDAALTLQAAGDYDVEYRIVRPDGAVRWIHDRAFPIRDADGRVYRVAGVAEDITAKRHLEEQFRQAQKMEAVGQLAGGIAHDFNNLLSVIQMQSSLLLEQTLSERDTREGIQDIMAAAERAANLTRQLLTFSRREVKQAKDLDMSEVIGTMTKLLRRVLGEDIALETRFASSLPVVNADPGMMEQVLMNLAVNARDAMPDGGRMSVTLDPADIDAERAAAWPGVTPGRFVCLAVSDAGCGIPNENLSRIFEPFFTTKEVGKGTGLGLATVFGIAQQHHGWVEVESVMGRGTTFRVYLPALPASTSQSARLAAAQAVRGGTETILLVEDEPAVRALARIVLERHGYRVVEAESAAAALQLWESQTVSVDLLLTDLIMPGGMSGRELAELLIVRQPALKVIYTSGYSNDVVNRQLRLHAGRNFLQKPCSATDLATSVRRCLDSVADGNAW